MSRLDPWRNGLDAPKGEDADRILQSNFDEIAKNFDKTGLYLKGTATLSAAVSTSGSYADIRGLKLSTTLDGGLVVLVAPLSFVVNNDDYFAQFSIKGQIKNPTRLFSAVANIVSNGTLVWMGNVGAGQTSISVQHKNSGVGSGSSVLSGNLYVLEFLKG